MKQEHLFYRPLLTWLEYVKQEALDSIEETYTFYNEAVKANDGVEPAMKQEHLFYRPLQT